MPSREVRDLLLKRKIMRESDSFAPRWPKSRSQYRAVLCHRGAFLALPPGLAHVLFRAQASITFHVPVTGVQQHRHGYRWVHREPVAHVRTVAEGAGCGPRPPGRNSSSQACMPWTLGRRLNSSVPLTSTKDDDKSAFLGGLVWASSEPTSLKHYE